MNNSNFGFIDDKVLRTNMDRVFDRLFRLLIASESDDYGEEEKSAFRKTVIFYTASIIEALLLYVLKCNKTEDECAGIKDKIGKTIYTIDHSTRIAIVEKVAEEFRFSKVNLDQINKLCKQHGLILKSLNERVDKIREMRNRVHIGSLAEIDRPYTKKDLEYVFSVARDVKVLAHRQTF